MKKTMILPIYNERKTMDAMLSQLEQIPEDVQVLFADGGSTDGTQARIPEKFTLLHCPKGRANQMNYAAGQAAGEVLWFVHCDSRLPKDGWQQITQAVEAGKPWGCFTIAFDYDGPFMGCNTYFSNRRARKGIAFGDQGIWVTKEAFDTVGGFPDLPIMEDYEFSRRMRRLGIPITQLPGTIVTSGRRYETRFPPLVMWQMFYLRCLYRSGVDIQEIARRYRDIR